MIVTNPENGNISYECDRCGKHLFTGTPDNEKATEKYHNYRWHNIKGNDVCELCFNKEMNRIVNDPVSSVKFLLEAL